MINKIIAILLFTATTVAAQQPTIQIIDTATKTSIRGLSVVNDSVFWVSGNNGKIGKCLNGNTVAWQTVKGFEKRDFRDVEAFSSTHALIMAVAEPAIILQTKDGGISWTTVFKDTTTGMFLDALYFDENGNGIVIGDPINNKIFVATTNNFGETWLPNIQPQKELIANDGEAFFASSGTNIASIKKGNKQIFLMATGGKYSSLILKGIEKKQLPILQGKESTGANSIAVFGNKAIVVGGDFANDTSSHLNCLLLHFSNKNKYSISQPITPPKGYKSCAAFINENTIITCGTTGVDISYNAGKTFTTIANTGFHVVQQAKNGSAIYLAGGRGRIAKLVL